MSGDAEGGGDRRRRLLLAGLAAFVVLGLALGAAGLDEVRLSSAGGSGGYDTDDPVEVGDTQVRPHPGGSEEVSASPYYVYGFFVLMALALVALAWRRDVQTTVAVVAVLIVFLFLLYYVGGAEPPLPTTNGSANATEMPNQSRLGSGTGTEPNTSPPATALPTGLLVFVGIAIGLSAILGYSRSGRSDDETEDEEKAADAETVADIGAAAGRAADRIAGDADLANPVYEAWRDMRAALDESGDPTLTPTEFRVRAVAAGLPPGPVGELTAVFREVRYGHEPATEARVEAAEASLREVEAAAEALAEVEQGDAATGDRRAADGTEGVP